MIAEVVKFLSSQFALGTRNDLVWVCMISKYRFGNTVCMLNYNLGKLTNPKFNVIYMN